MEETPLISPDIDTTGFTKNLDDSVNSLQSLARKVDQLPLGIPEAPADTIYYGRRNNVWVNLKTYFDSLYSVLSHTHSTYLTDAASDNLYYGRRNGAWINLKTYFDTLYNLYVHPNHSGDVTSVGDGATTIGAGKVTLAKLANMATASVFYRKTAGTGAPEVQTLATLKTDLGLTGTNSGDQNIKIPFTPYDQYALFPITYSSAYAFSATIDRSLTLVKWTQAFYVATTNNSTNYWSVGLYNSAGALFKSFTTYNAGVGETHDVWYLNPDTTTFSDNTTTIADKIFTVWVGKTGSPGGIYLAAPALEVSG